MNGYGLILNNGRSGTDLSHSLSLCGPPCRSSCSSPFYRSNRRLGSRTAEVHTGSPLDGNRGPIETLHWKHPIWQRYRTNITTLDSQNVRFTDSFNFIHIKTYIFNLWGFWWFIFFIEVTFSLIDPSLSVTILLCCVQLLFCSLFFRSNM